MELTRGAHDAFFAAAAGFVGGAAAGGLGFPPLFTFAAAAALAAAAHFLQDLRPLRAVAILAALSFALGSLHYTLDDVRYLQAQRAVLGETSFTGTVVTEPRRRLDSQIATVRTESSARLYVHTEAHPPLYYGDTLHIEGAVTAPPHDSYGAYMAKEHVHGTLFRPDVLVLGRDANPLFSALYGARGYIKRSLASNFTQSRAAFLNGVMLGERDEFTREFLDKLSVSGTMHLTALSGLHMTIIAFVILAIFTHALQGRKRLAFFASFATIALFVAMTGFKVSAVRASLMAFLVGLANETGRAYLPRNAIAFSALVITLFNPKAPVFDLGFQLSFAATLSIIYLAPVLKRIPFLHRAGMLGWRDVLAITAAAQLGVAPIAMLHFANFSFTALPANVGILVVIPFLIIFGFATVAASLVFPPLASLIALPTTFLIDYATAIIEVFSIARVMFNPEIGAAAALAYYAALVWLCWRFAPATAPKTV
ncbi:hypothetical protein COU20_02785 [Candidatus Kaiserbacteria bacterium CG10_big_fil_rev_8_21_14_0_10_59_10]|uniref:ComEC/Rec2-related protein domain-containing protein n=1 Tax=Candidatus Kaiserbacteria bacterium CG10_big_fil_rev_8_21_14_0_10_59_10 TaxID=1974612 RepID=A0A2H0U7C5_9BACT|nr:MAG: hypothetical protein COU20_02785 [Candidatus Kaiserbacteria bacterium CG10_big_fil_rev_8_21_14_0_10_59_10]